MLSDYIKKVNLLLTERRTDVFVAWLIILVSIASFGLGRLSALWPKKTPLTVENSRLSELGELSKSSTVTDRNLNQLNSLNSLDQLKGKYVASKNGKSYHLPWCSGASLIKEENKVWFETKEAAEKAGYTPAGNCPGL